MGKLRWFRSTHPAIQFKNNMHELATNILFQYDFKVLTRQSSNLSR